MSESSLLAECSPVAKSAVKSQAGKSAITGQAQTCTCQGNRYTQPQAAVISIEQSAK